MKVMLHKEAQVSIEMPTWQSKSNWKSNIHMMSYVKLFPNHIWLAHEIKENKKKCYKVKHILWNTKNAMMKKINLQMKRFLFHLPKWQIVSSS